MSDYDVAILGGGPGGYTAALRAAQRGASVALIEQNHLGGTCLNVGCIPTKAMLHASELAYRARTATGLGLTLEHAALDGLTFMDRVVRTVSDLRKGVEGLVKARKITVIHGTGMLTAPTTINVTGAGDAQDITATAVIIATGSRAVRPAFVPADSPRILTNVEATTAEDIPLSVLIVGGGVIGCEFATVYGELGTHTVLVEMMDDLLPGLDADAAKIAANSLKERGVHIRTGATIESMTVDEASVTTDLSSGQRVITHAALLAVGRQANINGIGLEDLGVKTADGVIAVDAHCRTNLPGLYAIGDAACTRQYAHVASRMGLVAADNATGHEAHDDLTVVPECIYTHPEIASVGLSEAAAKEQFDDVHVVRFPLRASGLAQAYGEPEGLTKLIARQGDGRILGAMVIAPRATDVIAEAALAIRHGLTVNQLAETIHAHPTFGETMHEAAEAWLGLPIHILRAR